MDEGANQISDRLRSTRQEFGGHLRQFGYRARHMQWRSYYERNPWLFVAAAFAGGLLLSAAAKRRRRSRVHDDERLEGPAEAAADGGSGTVGSGTSDIWDRIKATLLAAAASQIGSFIREGVPGAGAACSEGRKHRADRDSHDYGRRPAETAQPYADR